jgi:hypothetical protein
MSFSVLASCARKKTYSDTPCAIFFAKSAKKAVEITLPARE